MAAKPKYLCMSCSKPVAVLVTMKYGKHKDGAGEVCHGSGTFVPANQIAKGPVGADEAADTPVEGRDFGMCGRCKRAVRLELKTDRDRAYTVYAAHVATNMDTCNMSGTIYEWIPEPVQTLPDIEDYVEGPTQARDGLFQQPGNIPGTAWKPASFQQPGSTRQSKPPVEPMTGMAADIAARMKEIFYAYTNRNTSDNRTAQTKLGPSEIGSPCDRRLAMSLLDVPPVNPGGDGWASFVGTSIHAGLADMFLWADARTGRFAVEVPLEFDSALVPRGTGDLLDRTLCLFVDHKAQGRWSLERLRTKGPSDVYRVQVHTYAHGARLKGEAVDHVAIVSWPREAASLDDLYVWTEPYDPSVALAALERVAEIGARVAEDPDWRQIPFDNTDCKYCPFHAPGDPGMTRGCPGK